MISNLNQAITSYSRNSEDADYQLPVLSETDWDQILRNVSMIAFVQNIPIGMKYYNNYAIATSTSNREYIYPNGIYLNKERDTSYHLPGCEKLKEEGNIVGYRNIDYVLKEYKIGDEVKYYYPHQNLAQTECYYCLVDRSLYNKTGIGLNAYYTALAREKYNARETRL